MSRTRRWLIPALVALFAAGRVWAAPAEGPCTLPPGEESYEKRTVVLPGGAEMTLVWIGEGLMEVGKGGAITLLAEPSEITTDAQKNNLRISLGGFWMGVCEVTQRQWSSVMGSNPSYFRGEELPVESVSWDDCAEFCRQTGLRLPTEMEWLYARNTPWKYPGKPWSWTAGNSRHRTHPVGRSHAGVAAIFDMDGNVCEWCADWFAPWPAASATNYAGPGTGTERVVCGGCWCGDEWFDTRLRKERLSLPPASRYNNVGFRVCLTPAADEVPPSHAAPF